MPCKNVFFPSFKSRHNDSVKNFSTLQVDITYLCGASLMSLTIVEVCYFDKNVQTLERYRFVVFECICTGTEVKILLWSKTCQTKNIKLIEIKKVIKLSITGFSKISEM